MKQWNQNRNIESPRCLQSQEENYPKLETADSHPQRWFLKFRSERRPNRRYPAARQEDK
jgi:hypothetical protein